jgi:iron complex transport system substrate-binding protein
MPHPLLPPGRAGGIPLFFLVVRACALAGWLLASSGPSAGQAARPKTAAPKITPAPHGRTTVDFARGFTIAYVGNCKVVTVRSPEAKTKGTQYLLVPRGTARPAGYAGALVIETPIRRLVGLSSMHVALADFLGAADLLVGLGSLKYASAPRVRQRIAQGQVFAVGEGKELNNELLIAQHPDLVMSTGWPGETLDRFQTLAAAGVPVLVNSEWVETTPLARAEWVKVMAVLLNKEDLVNQKFGQVVRDYQRLAALGRRAAKRPKVVVGLPFKDVWYVPDADSYLTQFLRDAGTTYAWDQAQASERQLGPGVRNGGPGGAHCRLLAANRRGPHPGRHPGPGRPLRRLCSFQKRPGVQQQPPHQRPGLQRLLGIGGGATRLGAGRHA